MKWTKMMEVYDRAANILGCKLDDPEWGTTTTGEYRVLDTGCYEAPPNQLITNFKLKISNSKLQNAFGD